MEDVTKSIGKMIVKSGKLKDQNKKFRHWINLLMIKVAILEKRLKDNNISVTITPEDANEFKDLDKYKVPEDPEV